MIEKISHIAAALGVVIAAFTLWHALDEQNQRASREEISKWQQVAVYNIILSHEQISFKEIKSKYLDASMQVSFEELPKNELKDDALRAALIDLQAANLIFLTTDKNYRVTMASWQYPRKERVLDLLNYDMKIKMLYPKVRLKIMDVLFKNCGQYTQEQLHREVDSTFKVEFAVFVDMLHQMRNREVLLYEDGTWCLTHDISLENNSTNGN
jgi:hypothetical protein